MHCLKKAFATTAKFVASWIPIQKCMKTYLPLSNHTQILQYALSALHFAFNILYLIFTSGFLNIVIIYSKVPQFWLILHEHFFTNLTFYIFMCVLWRIWINESNHDTFDVDISQIWSNFVKIILAEDSISLQCVHNETKHAVSFLFNFQLSSFFHDWILKIVNNFYVTHK